MSLTPSQQRAVEAPGSVSVIAGAGTGKTHMLTERYAWLVQCQRISPLQIVAVTFTEKAAEELRQRIQRRLERVCDDEVLLKLSAAPMSTIHALCARIVRQHPEEAGVPPAFDIVDEAASVLWNLQLFREALSAMSVELQQRFPFRVLVSLVDAVRYDPEGVMRGLSIPPEEQKQRLHAFQEQSFTAMQNDPRVASIRQTLNAFPGPPGDKREDIRALVLSHITRLMEGEVPEFELWIKAINLRGGKKKEWGEDAFQQVGDALKHWRDDVLKPYSNGPLGWSESQWDSELQAALPHMEEACRFLVDFFDAHKRTERLLDFNDLERGALRALRHPEVVQFYQARWKVFFIDEFQDTNPVQGEILQRLTQKASLTIVGDPNQSIYGFRRAEPRLFHVFEEDIVRQGGRQVSLDMNFRTNDPLLRRINHLAESLLDPYVRLNAHRSAAPNQAPVVDAFVIQAERGVSKNRRVRMEARCIARRIRSLLDSGIMIGDVPTEQRPLQPGDIVILSQTWAPLQQYGDALIAEGIPVSSAAGGSLLETREAKDILALLQFLADPENDIALVSVLRSPWFAISDTTLFRIVRENGTEPHWWNRLLNSDEPEIQFAKERLESWLNETQNLSPLGMIRLADDETGYSAAIGNLSGANRRLSDWLGMLELLTAWQEDASDLFATVKKLEAICDAEIEISRPGIEAGNTVSLMTIHASKGLEWPVVVLPDLSRRKTVQSDPVIWHPDIGMAKRFTDEHGEIQKPILFRWIEHERQQREAQEQNRLFYVAMTRACDHLILCANEEKGGQLDSVMPSLEQIGINVEEILYEETGAITLPEEESNTDSLELLLEPMGCGITELPVTALSAYVQCPKRFWFRYVLGYPEGVVQSGDGGQGRRIGNVVHAAMQYQTKDEAFLAGLEPGVSKENLRNALRMVNTFYEHECFSPVRDSITGRETPVMIRWTDPENSSRQMLLNGIIDAIGIHPDGTRFILDYKTDQWHVPEHHQMQIAVYCDAIHCEKGFLAYLNDTVEKEPKLVPFAAETLRAAKEQADQVIHSIMENRFDATPEEQTCAYCPHKDVCPEAFP